MIDNFAISLTWLSSNYPNQVSKIFGNSTMDADRVILQHEATKAIIIDVSEDIEPLWISALLNNISYAINYKNWWIGRSLGICMVNHEKILCIGDNNLNIMFHQESPGVRYFFIMLESFAQ